MTDVAIRVEGLSKAYQIRHSQARSQYRTLREDLVSLAQKPLKRGGGQTRETFWALDDVSFEVKHGEALGIIGRNGAGKSTLLKILSRITKPTKGQATVYGRVGSLLEVGTGFHPELTGRENIFLNGAILGMTRRDIQRHFDEIVAFAEIEQFLDTPVKRYSSGMYMRLAFAVAAHLEPEVLVVDEVLAVGDAAFQKKCLGKMGEVASGGRTVLFVSHNMSAVQALCGRAVLLSEGRILLNDVPETVTDAYLSSASSPTYYTATDREWGDAPARIASVLIVRDDERGVAQIGTSDSFTLEIVYKVRSPNSVLNLSVSVYSSNETYVLASPSLSDKNWSLKPHHPGLYVARCAFPPCLFNRGHYRFTVLLVQNGSQVLEQLDYAVTLEFVDDPSQLKGYFGFWGGVVRPNLDWKIEAN